MKKKRSQVVQEYLRGYLSEENWQAVADCGSMLWFAADEDLDKKKLIRANFCGNRFCPMCAWRRAIRDSVAISAMMAYIEDVPEYVFIYLTLTAPNVSGAELSASITKFNIAFKNMMQTKKVKAVNQGYVRKLEVTYNPERDDYHPHFHAIIAVKPSYFKHGDYINRGKWLALWRQAMDDPTITQVDVRRVVMSLDSSPILEIAKYNAKDEDMTYNSEVFDTMYNAIKGRQKLTYNGVFALANKMFKDDMLNDYIQRDTTRYIYFLLYNWDKGRYVCDEYRKLTNEELFRLKQIDRIPQPEPEFEPKQTVIENWYGHLDA